MQGQQQLAPQQQQPYQAGVQAGDIGQLNRILGRLQEVAQTSTLQISKLRIEKWKADSRVKQQAQANAESLQRNLSAALPELVGKVRNAPQDLGANFRLYRNLNVLYDVFVSFTESAGAFGPKDQYEALAQQVGTVDALRRQLGDRFDQLLISKDMEISQLRNQVRALAQAKAAEPPKKIVVDDTIPSKPKKKKAKPATPPQTAQP
ncbi:MAG TPA: hypothetical protein VN622_08645 [Clostridia bacterium]|nr:hypothetical protein [Clostridia bacterium]